METVPTATTAAHDERTPAGGKTPNALVRACRALQASRSRRVIALLVLLWALNFFDLAYTICAHRAGHFHELNPIARGMLEHPWLLAAFKVLGVATGTTILACLRRHRLAELAAWLLVLAYVALTIEWLDYCAALFART